MSSLSSSTTLYRKMALSYPFFIIIPKIINRERKRNRNFHFLIRINISYWNCSSFSHDEFKQKHKKLELKQEGKKFRKKSNYEYR